MLGYEKIRQVQLFLRRYLLSINITLVATSLSKPISRVIITMVSFSSARSRITFNTSHTISGSRAEVGSSKSITSGFMQSALTYGNTLFLATG